MRKTALLLALAIAAPAWAQDKPAAENAVPEKPAAQEAPKDEAKADAAKKPHSRKHSSKRMEDARHCLDEPTNSEIIKCAEAYL